jgi:hypothetical protein
MPYTKLQSSYSKNLSIPYSLNDPYNPYSYTQTFPIFENSIKTKENYETSKPKILSIEERIKKLREIQNQKLNNIL